MYIILGGLLFWKRRDHLIVIERTHSSPQQAAGIAVDVTANIAAAPAAGTPAAGSLAAGTPLPGTEVAGIGRPHEVNMPAAHRNIAVAV